MVIIRVIQTLFFSPLFSCGLHVAPCTFNLSTGIASMCMRVLYSMRCAFLIARFIVLSILCCVFRAYLLSILSNFALLLCFLFELDRFRTFVEPVVTCSVLVSTLNLPMYVFNVVFTFYRFVETNVMAKINTKQIFFHKIYFFSIKYAIYESNLLKFSLFFKC